MICRNWYATNALFTKSRFLFDLLYLLVSENPDKTLLKLCELNLSSVHLGDEGCTIVLQTIKTRSYISCKLQRLNFEYLLSITCRQKSTVEWHWLIFFRARSWISVSSISAADKFVTNGWQTGQPSPTTLTLNGFTRNAKHCFNFCKWSNLAWNSSSSLAIYFCVLPPSWSAITSSRKGFALILTLGKWQKAFDNMLLRKILSSITLTLGSLFCYQIA